MVDSDLEVSGRVGFLEDIPRTIQEIARGSDNNLSGILEDSSLGRHIFGHPAHETWAPGHEVESHDLACPAMNRNT